jgi:hypothetical protein
MATGSPASVQAGGQRRISTGHPPAVLRDAGLGSRARPAQSRIGILGESRTKLSLPVLLRYQPCDASLGAGKPLGRLVRATGMTFRQRGVGT